MRVYPTSLVLAATLVAGCNENPPAPDPEPQIASARLRISMPTSAQMISIGLAPECGVVAGGIQLPIDTDVELLAEFLNDANELDPYANVAQNYRLSGDGVANPSPSVASVTFTRTSGLGGTLRGGAEASGTVSLSLVRAASGDVAWGPCAIPIAVVAPEPAPPNWAAVPSSPLSLGTHFQDASFVSPARGWVIGIPGDVYYTNDGGSSWEHRFATPENSSASTFRSVAFLSDTKGFVGDLNRFNNPEPLRSLWETTDGGFTWANVSSRVTGAAVTGICGMWVVSPTTIVGVGRWNGPARFVKTTDAGATWQAVALEPLVTGAVDVYFFDAMNGIIAGGRGVGNLAPQQQSSVVVILGTTDGGATWSERFVGTIPGSWSWKISFPTPQIGYVATQGPTSGPTVLKTLDGGVTWREMTIGTGPEGGMWGAGFISARTGWVAADNGVWQTRDGGLTWSQTSWGLDGSVNRFRIQPNGTAFAVGKQVYRFAP